MRLRAAIVASILMAASQSAFGAFFFGAGSIRCGEWTRVRAVSESGPLKDVGARHQLEAWIDGYISGVNVRSVELSSQPDFLASQPQSSALYAVVDNYCKASPLDPIVDATMALVRELRMRARR